MLRVCSERTLHFLIRSESWDIKHIAYRGLDAIFRLKSEKWLTKALSTSHRLGHWVVERLGNDIVYHRDSDANK